jgi:RHS repeat-associated protein
VAQPRGTNELDIGDAKVYLGAGAVTSWTTLSAEVLNPHEIPPLDPGMTNVTSGRGGFRFLPHPHQFEREIVVSLPYCQSLLPAGLTDADVRTFYFDERRRHWRPLPRLGVDDDGGAIVSKTNHFTDMINATIAVPEHPSPTTFAPALVADVPKASPAAGINLIEPPQANSTGDARLSYPLDLPPGRLGLQPRVALTYNSENGNGWVGVGWDLITSAISIDTRWGAARYDAAKETETYMLDGEQLTPVAHRGELRDRRKGDQGFHTRVESQFRKIVRHGANPKSYWWEVVDKDGTRHFYGGDPDAGRLPKSVLADPRLKNIFRWPLRETRDLHGNTIRYAYDIVGGVARSVEPWRQMYLREIAYTGTKGSNAAYTVTFRRTKGRPDPIIDGRSGFKTLLNDRLTQIDVRTNGALVRRYTLAYDTGVFGKSRLVSVAQLGDDGTTELARHGFGYYDGVKGKHLFQRPYKFRGATTQTYAFGLVSSTGFRADKTSSGQFNAGLGVTVLSAVKFGVKGGSSSADSATDLGLVDLNGDGLLDQVFARDGRLFYRPNRITSGRPSFSVEQLVDVPAGVFRTGSFDHSSTSSFGPEVTLFDAIRGERIPTTTVTEGSQYFSDVNGDLLPDLVVAGTVYYNALRNGVPTFTRLSPTPLASDATVDSSRLLPAWNPYREEMERRFHLIDPIRRWIAPYDGKIRITGSVSFVGARPDATDGATAFIQIGGDALWNETVNAVGDAKSFDLEREVHAGDPVYFRLSSIDDGRDDAVTFTPTITYLEVANGPPNDSAVDENEMPLFSYDAASDFALAGRGAGVSVNRDGTALFTATLDKAVTTDDVAVEVLSGAAVVFHRDFPWREPVLRLRLEAPIDVHTGRDISVRIRTDSRIDLSAVSLSDAALTYLTIDGQPAPRDRSGAPLIVMHPPVAADVYPRVSPRPYEPWVMPAPGGCMRMEQFMQPSNATLPRDYDAELTVSVKRPGNRQLHINPERLFKHVVRIEDGSLFDNVISGLICAPAGARLYFVVDASAPRSFAPAAPSVLDAVFIDRPSVAVEAQGAPERVAFDAHQAPDRMEPFAGGFRGWGFGQYNPADARDRIDETRLRLPTQEHPQWADDFLPMLPISAENRYRVDDRESWIAAGTMSSSRFGEDNPAAFGRGRVSGARAVVRGSAAEATSASISLDTPVGGPGWGSTTGSGWSAVDFFDLNGDRYPDVVAGNFAQTTLPNGALTPPRGLLSHTHCFSGPGFPMCFPAVRSSRSATTNLGFGAKLSMNQSDSRSRVETIGTVEPVYGLAAGLTGATGTYAGESDYVDMNGDGLPDLVATDGKQLRVRLNLGRRFARPANWGALPTVGDDPTFRVQTTSTAGMAIGASASLGGSFGGGLSVTTSTAATVLDLVDVNGDALPDLVTKPVSAQRLAVRLNSGAALAPIGRSVSYDRPLSVALQANGTVSASLGLSFAISIPIIPGILSIDIGVGGSRSESLGGFEATFTDLNGDGYADHNLANTRGLVATALNTHGPTNLLRSIRRPLGAAITLSYGRSGNTEEQPGNRWVLAATNIDDGVAGDGIDRQAATYEYEDGRYDRTEREFYGYRRVVERQLDVTKQPATQRSIERTYLNRDYYTKGLLTRQVLFDKDGTPFVESASTYETVAVDDGAAIAELEDFTATRFPQLREATRRFYEGKRPLGDPGKSTKTTYEYDSVGNVSVVSDAGELATSSDDIETRIEYSDCADEHVLASPVEVVVKGGGTTMRRTTAEVDCKTGEVRTIRAFLDDDTAAETTLRYFANGNLREVEGPMNLHQDRYRLTYEYDDATATHVKKTTDSFGYSSSAVYDAKFGTLSSVTDLNGNVTTYARDLFGRLSEVSGPYDQDPKRATLRFEYHPADGVPWARTQEFDGIAPRTDPRETVILVDGLMRPLQTKRDATVYTDADAPARDVMIASGRVTFDFAGRPVERRYPTTVDIGSAGALAAPDDVAPTRMEYDPLDRVTSTTLPDASGTLTEYGFGTADNRVVFQRTLTDAEQNQRTVLSDVRQHVVAIREPNPADAAHPLETTYAYDALGQLVRVEDAKHNPTRLDYDDLGRRVAIDNPDAGLIETTYDTASNVTALTTPRLRPQHEHIDYDYDFLRLKTIRYPHDAANDVTYTYGSPTATDNRAGRITVVEDASGREERTYGKLGELVQQTKTVSTHAGPPPESYSTKYAYDTFGRLRTLTYPDLEVVTYDYDSGGNVKSAKGGKEGAAYTYVGRLEYDKFGQRRLLETGDGVRTTYTYRPDNRRLQTLTSGRTDAQPFQNASYTYDKVGNVKTITNDVPLATASQFGGPTVESFTYDSLYRLKDASGTYRFAPSKTRSYTLSLTYDAIHNIKSKTQTDIVEQPSGASTAQKPTTYSWTYTYGNPQPHAPSGVGDRAFTYGPNGNQLGWAEDRGGGRRIVDWDEENRIRSITDGGHKMTYTYDHAGERGTKRGPQGETAYVNRYFTVRNRTGATKHIFVGDERVASKLGKANSYEKDQYFYHADHLGSARFITDRSGELYEHMEYFPSGETWIDESTNIQRTPYLFSGKELDEETGLYYFGARYYDPRVATFVSVDPAWPAFPSDGGRTLNVYSYALANPLSYVDPDGRDPEAAKKSLGVGVGLGRASMVNEGTTVDRSIYKSDYFYHEEQITRDIGRVPGSASLSFKSSEGTPGIAVEPSARIGTETIGVRRSFLSVLGPIMSPYIGLFTETIFNEDVEGFYIGQQGWGIGGGGELSIVSATQRTGLNLLGFSVAVEGTVKAGLAFKARLTLVPLELKVEYANVGVGLSVGLAKGPGGGLRSGPAGDTQYGYSAADRAEKLPGGVLVSADAGVADGSITLDAADGGVPAHPPSEPGVP